ncbi:hypothetical protein [Mycobacteroides chelonae]|uniref:hypothetical protein n=1 Tax=Mycobacteroides chelonae TaxID=1774 RepID=UPI0010420210|nr:hypothetical protein [Mycobacteroides chelonae]
MLSNTQHSQIGESLRSYAERILAGTGLDPQDVLREGAAVPGTAAEALRHGWQTAERAGRVQA